MALNKEEGIAHKEEDCECGDVDASNEAEDKD